MGGACRLGVIQSHGTEPVGCVEVIEAAAQKYNNKPVSGTLRGEKLLAKWNAGNPESWRYYERVSYRQRGGGVFGN